MKKQKTGQRIDHVSTARGALTNAAALLQSHDDAGALGMATVANAEATLALVEQQRIANLIALGQFRIGPNDLPPLRHLVVEPADEYKVQPVEAIREGLGL